MIWFDVYLEDETKLKILSEIIQPLLEKNDPESWNDFESKLFHLIDFIRVWQINRSYLIHPCSTKLLMRLNLRLNHKLKQFLFFYFQFKSGFS